MKRVTSRELNQDVSRAKRFALVEPVFVTDRGRPTHVLISIDAWRQLSGERETMAQLLAAPPGDIALDRTHLRKALDGRPVMFLLDAEILFDLRHARADGDGAALAGWAQRTSRQSMFLSALSLVELENGAALATKQSKAAGAAWRDWIDGQLLPAFEGRDADALWVDRRDHHPNAAGHAIAAGMLIPTLAASWPTAGPVDCVALPIPAHVRERRSTRAGRGRPRRRCGTPVPC